MQKLQVDDFGVLHEDFLCLSIAKKSEIELFWMIFWDFLNKKNKDVEFN